MSGSYLIQDACILTLGHRTQNHAQADLLIEGGIVADVGNGLRSRDAEVIDGSNTIVMPGFVDAHRRCWPSLFKNDVAATGTRATAEPSPDDVYAGILLSLLGAIESGITTVVDWYDGPASDGHLEAALQAHADVHVRTVLVLAAGVDRAQTWTRSLERHGLTPSPMTTLAAGSPSVSGADVEDISDLWTVARGHGLHIHALGAKGDEGAMVDLNDRGLLGADVTVAHCTGLPDDDLEALASSETGIALTPTTDMTSGAGSPPMQALLDRDVSPGLGVGDDFAGSGDIFAQMRAAISIQHARYFDLKLAGKGGLPNLLSTRDVIRYGTISGAGAIGLDSVTGSIEVGKQADLVLLRTDRANIHPVNDPIGAVVWGMDTSNVDWVFAAGEVLMRSGDQTADVGRARSLAVEARRGFGPAPGHTVESDARSRV